MVLPLIPIVAGSAYTLVQDKIDEETIIKGAIIGVGVGAIGALLAKEGLGKLEGLLTFNITNTIGDIVDTVDKATLPLKDILEATGPNTKELIENQWRGQTGTDRYSWNENGDLIMFTEQEIEAGIHTTTIEEQREAMIALIIPVETDISYPWWQDPEYLATLPLNEPIYAPEETFGIYTEDPYRDYPEGSGLILTFPGSEWNDLGYVYDPEDEPWYTDPNLLHQESSIIYG